jgi:hypothetical protein
MLKNLKLRREGEKERRREGESDGRRDKYKARLKPLKRRLDKLG